MQNGYGRTYHTGPIYTRPSIVRGRILIILMLYLEKRISDPNEETPDLCDDNNYTALYYANRDVGG